ncbi:MAG TPA: hypothetical protein VMH27_22620 [Puia sp.]|nr:hypothetical protein [Puia sp.]
MKNTVLLLPMIMVVMTGWAQRDTTRMDMGWLSVDKGLTQTITIKGEDLEKMPFVNLSDAISAWLYGAYTTPGTLAYVVDGNPITDVNIYPIFDIEEVTLVQSAAGSATYGGTQQELVLITTRQKRGKSGLRAAAQGGLVNSNGDGSHTTAVFYHQYYLGAYRNGEKFSGGLSADWIRDAVPLPSGNAYQVITPDNLQRLRIDGHLSWTPTNRDIVELRLSYAPERLEEAIDSTINQDYRQVTTNLRSHLLIPEIRWSSESAHGLRSDLHASYVSGAATSAFNLIDSTAGFGKEHFEDSALQRTSQLFVRERLSLNLKAGNWQIQPALNFFYDHITEKTATSFDSIAGWNMGQLIVYDLPLGPWKEQKADLLFLTPAVDFRLARVFDLQIGTQMNLGGQKGSGSNTLLPFVTAGLDVLHFDHHAEGASLKLFGSYAQRSTVFLDDYSLFDFSGAGAPYSVADVNQPKTTTASFSSYDPITGATTIANWEVTIARWPVFWDWQAGAGYAAANGRLQVQYTFERRNFVTPGGATYLYSTGEGLEEPQQWTSDLHHADIRFRVTATAKASWETGLNLTLLKSKGYVDFPGAGALGGLVAYTYSYQGSAVGDVDPAHLSYTGGWVNRVKVGDFVAGLDLLYHFGQTLPAFNGVGIVWTGPRTNSVLVPNVYAGYGWQLKPGHRLELFLESRGLVRSKSADLLDDRRYYTLGGKFAL